jgi:hypothetical protein
VVEGAAARPTSDSGGGSSSTYSPRRPEYVWGWSRGGRWSSWRPGEPWREGSLLRFGHAFLRLWNREMMDYSPDKDGPRRSSSCHPYIYGGIHCVKG